MLVTSPPVALPATAHSVFYSYTIGIGTATTNTEVGSFEKFSRRSTRTVERIRNICYNSGAQAIDMLWGGSDISLELSHVELYTASILDALSGNVGTDTKRNLLLDLEQWNFMFNIFESMYEPATATTRIIMFGGCVPSDVGKEVDTGTARVLETMTVQVSTVVGSKGWPGA